AVKFTPKGGKVTISARLSDGPPPEDDEDAMGAILLAPLRKQIEVRVSDTGIGIPAGERAKVFDAFYQVDSSSTREFGGTGLGLSIVNRLVEAQGGTVCIEGNQPRGGVFVVTLPSAASAPISGQSSAPPAE